MFNNSFELSVEVNGRPIPEFGHKGRTYVEGRKHNRYQLKFRNNRPERVLVVPTVDGLSVVDGIAYHGNSPGYVVQAYSSLTISGWRTSLAEVRSFEFGDKRGSVAGKTTGKQNCGVIGALVYAEQRPNIQWQDIHIHHHNWPPPTVIYPPITTWHITGEPTFGAAMYCSGGSAVAGNAAPNSINMTSPGVSTREVDQSVMYCSVQNSTPDFNLGTTYGAPIQDNVNRVDFEKGLCLATMEIYYSDRAGLLKDGIPVDKAPELASFPQAFGGFCKLPS